MSAYSDWRCGAMTDDEYLAASSWEARRDAYYEGLSNPDDLFENEQEADNETD